MTDPGVRAAIAGAVVLALAAIIRAGPQAPVTFSGRAVTEAGTHWYTEEHRVTRTDGRLHSETRYIAPNGDVLAELAAEFGARRYLPNTTFFDHRDHSRYTITLAPDASRVTVAQRDGPNAKDATKTLDVRDDLMTYVGALAFISDRLPDLLNGTSFVVEYLVPSRLNAYRLRISRRAVRGGVLNLRMEMDNFLYRWFASPMDLKLDSQTGRVLEFEGTAGLLDAFDHAVRVRITYSYQ